jgi:hypothetical protein
MTAELVSGRWSRDHRLNLARCALETAGYVVIPDPAGFLRIRPRRRSHL